LQIIKKRAIKENVSYIETMLSTVGVHSSLYFDKTNIARLNNAMRTAKTNDALSIEFDAMVKVLSGDQGFREIVLQFVQSTANVHQGIDDGQFMMRYQTYAVRVLDPVQVFVDLYSGFLAADQSPLVVGVNILAPENNVVALADYTLHMKMYAYLLKQHPNVNRALHAGELTLGMVRPKDLDFHIGQALNIAQAQRIGHGIDLPYEQNSVGLLEDLRKNSVIEINLTSNQHILGVQKEAHPYAIYASYGVPLVISTDDSGVSRNNLSNEYVLLASRYKPGYKTLKSIVYNSILYSFMSDSDKSENLRRLDERFAIFEAKMAGIADRLMH
jgi:adenosine deaminase/adenosine deaminase CECR1